jgi:putative DNA primase/helicase
MSSTEAPQEDLNELDFATLDELRAGGEGPLDHPCPLCGPARETEFNRTRPTLRTWEPEPGFITYYCARCDARDYARITDADVNWTTDFRPVARAPQAKLPPPRQAPAVDDTYRLFEVERLWNAATCDLPEKVIGYFAFRGIQLDTVPKGVLRFHAKCPWLGKKMPCILARYSDAVTGAPRGLWRRLYGEKPMTLGPMSGCVIRLYPKVGKRLVVAEGVENALTAATLLSHRGMPMRPAWATGCANNLRRLPVLDGVEHLIILVDNDKSGTGQKAAAECAERWSAAGRKVTRLMPKEEDTDFNDFVRG